LQSDYGIDLLPGFVLDSMFAKTARFAQFAHIVERVNDGFVPDTRLTPIAQIMNGQDAKGLDLFLDVDSPASLAMAERLLRWVGEVNDMGRLRLHFVGGGPQNETFRRAQQVAPDRVGDALLCYLLGQRNGGNLSADDCLKQTGITLKKVDNQAATLAIAQALGVRPEMAPAVVVDGRFVVQANGLTEIERFFYRLHPDLAQRDRNSARRSVVE